MSALQELDALLNRLEGAEAGAEAPARSAGQDAIDVTLAEAPRATAVRRMRESEVVQRFRAELAAGRVELATVRSFLEVVGRVLDVVLAGRA